jgi:hypothetical protein
VISRHGVEREIAVALSRYVAFEDAPFTRGGIASYVDSVMAGIRSPPELSLVGRANADRGQFLQFGGAFSASRSGIGDHSISRGSRAACSPTVGRSVAGTAACFFVIRSKRWPGSPISAQPEGWASGTARSCFWEALSRPNGPMLATPSPSALGSLENAVSG